MKTDIFEANLKSVRFRLEELVATLQDMAQASHDEGLAQTVSELRQAVNEPFLFVIVGEVKTGKSSFINALLATGADVVKVAPDPCTDTVQQVIYGDEPQTIEVNPFLKKIMQPAEILKHISVVDTPGTNTIEDKHQEITEGYIPRSDLIVFVFEAKNPYRQSAWDFLDYIRTDWRKKVIFVLQQVDLMPAEDLAVNVKGVKNYAHKKGIDSPQVFPLSAKLELEGKQEESGFGPLKAYIRDEITGRNAYRLKLQSNLETVGTLEGRIKENVDKMAAQLQMDRRFREEVIELQHQQEGRSHKQIDSLIQTLLGDYDRITHRAETELSDGLGLGPMLGKMFSSIFKKSNSPQRWLKEISNELKVEMETQVNRRLNEGVEEIAESIAQMVRIVDLKIQNSTATLREKEDVFGEISERRRAVIQDLRDGFDEFVHQTEHFLGREVVPETSKLSPNVLTGGSVAIIGAVLTIATQIPLLDITGGIMSALGIAVAGGTVIVKRGKIMKGFAQEIKKGRRLLEEELDRKLKGYVGHIRQKIDDNFRDFDALLKAETSQVEHLNTQLKEVAAEREAMLEKLEG